MLKLIEKNKNDKWYKEIADQYLTSLNAHQARPDFHEKAKLYRFFNNDLSDYIDEINMICNDVISVGAASEMLLHYNKIRNKYDVLHGELLKRGNNHKIILLSAKAIKDKNEKLIALIQENVEKDVQVLMSRVIETLQTMPQQELQKFIEEERQMLTPRDINYKNFMSDVEIYKNKMLKYAYMNEDVLKKKADSFQHQFIISEFYIKNTWHHGRPGIQLCNPLYCSYDKSGNETDVSKSDWFRYSDEITLGQALDEYMNILSKDDIEKLMKQSWVTNGIDNSHMEEYVRNFANWHFQNQMLYNGQYGQYWGLSETNTVNNSIFTQKVKRTHLEFKAFKEVLFYSYNDEYNDTITIMLDSKANIIPENASKVSYINEYFEKDYAYVWNDELGNENRVEIKWIPRRYEMTRLGFDLDIQKREVPFQPDNTDSPISSFTLSYKGGQFNNVNSKACSRLENALPSQLQIIAAKTIQNKEMGKFRGSTIFRDIAQIPMELAENTEGNAQDILTKIEVIGRKTGTEYYDSDASKNGIPNNQRGAAVQSSTIGDANLFVYLQNFIQLLDIEVGLNCGVPPQREGQMVQGNVTDNQQVLIQTALATEKDFFEHSRVWNTVLMEYLQSYDQYFQKMFEKNPDMSETFLEYITPDGTAELIQILPSYISQSGYGLFVQDGYSDKEYKDLMKMQMAQNTMDVPIEMRSNILKNITSGASTEEIHREIQMFADAIQKRQQQAQEMEQQMIENQKQAQLDLMKYQSELRVLEAQQMNEATKETKIELEKIAAERFALQEDINKNKISDSVEKEKIKQQHEDMRHDKELKSKEKIAKENNIVQLKKIS